MAAFAGRILALSKNRSTIARIAAFRASIAMRAATAARISGTALANASARKGRNLNAENCGFGSAESSSAKRPLTARSAASNSVSDAGAAFKIEAQNAAREARDRFHRVAGADRDRAARGAVCLARCRARSTKSAIAVSRIVCVFGASLCRGVAAADRSIARMAKTTRASA